MYEYWQYLGDSIQLSANTNVSNPIYNWSSIAYVSCYNCSNPYTSATDTTLYLLTVTDSETGCFAVDSIIIYTLDNSEVFLPTGFSPNGDQINDVFYFRGIGIKDFNLNVFDRWGELIFTTNSFSVGWDGSYKGKPAIEGTYVYTLNYTNFKKINKFLKGNLTLIK
jgi:gliding motility-associated-like protein